MFLPVRDTRALLIKWLVALLVPLAVFTFVWYGDQIINTVLLGFIYPGSSNYDTPTLIQAAIFSIVLYMTIIALAGYLVAVDTGRRGMIEVWIDVAVFTLIPLILVILTGLTLGLALCAIVWPAYFYIRRLVRKARHYTPPQPEENLKVLDEEQQAILMGRAIMGGFWCGLTLAAVWLIADLLFYFTGALNPVLLIFTAIRTLVLPVAGYFLGRLSGVVALRHVLKPARTGNGGNPNGGGDMKGANRRVSKRRQLEVLSTIRVREEARDIVPNDLPLRSSGARRFYLILLVAFVLFYPVLDPFLFGPGSDARLSGYGDAGYYVILALGLNIVVGFAGLLDLGYVAFFAIGSYTWALFGSNQFFVLTNINLTMISQVPLFHTTLGTLWGWFFWPMLLITALVAATFGVILGAPTLRLRGDYLAIVTLGFGAIIPVVFKELDVVTRGDRGITGVLSPTLPGVDWTFSEPYYYLILALIVLTVFANIRLRDSRLGRAWVAIREDEVAAASSGVNLVRTKLFAFAAGAFFSGFAGAYNVAKLNVVTPDRFDFSNSVIYLAMVVIGGLGSIPGVIVGALAVYTLNEFIFSQFSDPSSPLFAVQQAIATVNPNFTFNNIKNMLFGITIIVIMIFRPEGMIPSARRRRELHQATDESGIVEVGSLDVTPGAPGFESEVRVE